MHATLLLSLASLVATASAQVALYQQCGGKNWSGSTTCVSGATCQVLNEYYSQCLAGSNGATTVTSSAVVTIGSTSQPPTPTVTPTGTGTNTAPQSTNSSAGKQIRTNQTPVYHLYLQNIGGKPRLGPEATSGYFVYGTTVGLVMADGSKLYLNVDMSVSTSYKPISFGTTATTTNWGLSGDTFRVGNTQNLLVCPVSGSSAYDIYLQTGSEMLSSSCTNYITMHLPCLC
ncbi:carbohydrate-binding module family 1 protein [Serendipita vermifera MAFF 305830]|uniref:Carbohydrate-binding module family 1 protein n=1 Tax=Serendipita vermifera MAFF 305830 TaxID=933852 RepID=A0A0C2XZG0_SERVB|nr:carbohydrate-binding module family 1 protein [Serendipita vermifera MAFF 305830]